MRHLSPFPLWKGVTVLVVEDHADSRDVLRQILRSLGARVLLAIHGEEALRLVTKDPPDLILCDLIMPVMDGFAFLKRLRQLPAVARTPVVAVTALGASGDLQETWEAGFDGHLTKPIDYETVAGTLERVLSGSRLPEEPDET